MSYFSRVFVALWLIHFFLSICLIYILCFLVTSLALVAIALQLQEEGMVLYLTSFPYLQILSLSSSSNSLEMKPDLLYFFLSASSPRFKPLIVWRIGCCGDRSLPIDQSANSNEWGWGRREWQEIKQGWCFLSRNCRLCIFFKEKKTRGQGKHPTSVVYPI